MMEVVADAYRSAGCVDVDAVSGVVDGRDADEANDGRRLRHVDATESAAFDADLLHPRDDADALQRRVDASGPPHSAVEYIDVLQHRFGHLEQTNKQTNKQSNKPIINDLTNQFISWSS